MPNPLRSYRCSGVVTTAGITEELAAKHSDSAYLDIRNRYDNTVRFSFRMNKVDAGYLDIPDVSDTFYHALRKGENFGSFYQKFEGELATFTGQDDAATFTEDTYAVSYRQYGPDDTFAVRLKARLNRDVPPSINVFLTPQQSHDLLALLQKLAGTQTLGTRGDLVLANGDTTTKEIGPP